MSYPTAIDKVFGNSNIETIDIREDSLANIKSNYIDYEIKEYPNIIITNPPFKCAIEIIEKALTDVSDKGFVIMLLRLNFFGSKDRKKFFDKHMPKYCFVHHRRMSFTESGSTDSIEYCHMVWQKGYSENYTKLFIV